MILVNMIKCNNCKDEIFSRSVHDFNSCTCGRVSVDGGMEYLRRVCENSADYTEMSYSLEDKIINDCVDAVKWARETKRNDLGTVLAIIRELKKHNCVIVEAAT